jgi:hypothetical protein
MSMLQPDARPSWASTRLIVTAPMRSRIVCERIAVMRAARSVAAAVAASATDRPNAPALDVFLSAR